MEVVPGASHGVPQPTQYKNVFKLIATVMYMFATVYFLLQIAMEFFRKKYMQAFVLLMMYLVGSSILYVAYRMVFYAP
jgi:K+-sensing histidine kinase KdpD